MFLKNIGIFPLFYLIDGRLLWIRNRLCTTNSIVEARAFVDRGDLSRTQLSLGIRRVVVQGSPAAQAGDQLCRVLKSELTESCDMGIL